MPALPQNSRDQAPPASTTASQAMRPFSVTTPDTRPAWVSMPRTAHSVRIVAPASRAASAIAGAAWEGSARPSRRRVHRGDERARRAGHQRVDLGTTQQTRVHLILARLGQPCFVFGDVLFGLAQIGDAGLAEAGLAVGAGVHAAPQPEAFDRQRDFPGVAAHGAAPAPVAAGLLAADAAFLAQHDRMALLGEEQRGGGADDAAADHHHPGAGRKTLVGLNEIDWGRHDVASSICCARSSDH